LAGKRVPMSHEAARGQVPVYIREQH